MKRKKFKDYDRVMVTSLCARREMVGMVGRVWPVSTRLGLPPIVVMFQDRMRPLEDVSFHPWELRHA